MSLGFECGFRFCALAGVVRSIVVHEPSCSLALAFSIPVAALEQGASQTLVSSMIGRLRKVCRAMILAHTKSILEKSQGPKLFLLPRKKCFHTFIRSFSKFDSIDAYEICPSSPGHLMCCDTERRRLKRWNYWNNRRLRFLYESLNVRWW